MQLKNTALFDKIRVKNDYWQINSRLPVNKIPYLKSMTT